MWRRVEHNELEATDSIPLRLIINTIVACCNYSISFAVNSASFSVTHTKANYNETWTSYKLHYNEHDVFLS